MVGEGDGDSGGRKSGCVFFLGEFFGDPCSRGFLFFWDIHGS